MKLLLKLFFLLILLFISTGSNCQIKSIDINALVNLMEGSFSSEEQSKNDSNYFDIRVHTKKIWKGRSDGQWLYYEQAHANNPEKPYMQRVYNINTTYEGRFEITEFTFNGPLRFAGDWEKEFPLSELTPDSLIKKNGCTVTVTLMKSQKENMRYEGGTDRKECQSDLPEAMYSTSEVIVSSDGITSLDRGYDEKGNQVWGSKDGGYFFKRINE